MMVAVMKHLRTAISDVAERRAAAVHQWWACLGSFGDDFFGDEELPLETS
jgi:hypothetical protein